METPNKTVFDTTHTMLRKMSTSSYLSEADREEALSVLMQRVDGTIPDDTFLELTRIILQTLILTPSRCESTHFRNILFTIHQEIVEFQILDKRSMVDIGGNDEYGRHNEIYLPKNVYADFVTALNNGQGKIAAIKFIRNYYGCGVMGITEAKEFVENYMARNGITMK